MTKLIRNVHVTRFYGIYIINKFNQLTFNEIFVLKFCKCLDIHFGKQQPDADAAIKILSQQLIKTSSVFAYNTSGLFVDSNQGKALRNAAAKGLDNELSSILSSNLDVINATDDNPNKGWTPLHWAIFKNKPSCVQLLLDFGARYDLHDKSELMQTAIDLSIILNDPTINQKLVKHIQNKYVKTEDKNLEKVLRNIANARDLDLDAVKLLIHVEGLNINSPSPSSGQTALHIAVIKKHIALVKFLLTHHAQYDIEDTQGKTALAYAANDPALFSVFSEHQLAINAMGSTATCQI